MKNLFLIAAILICSLGSAQNNAVENSNGKSLKFGLKGGINIASQTDSRETGIGMEPRIGFNIGGYLNYKFTDDFALQPEIFYTTQGNRFYQYIDGVKLDLIFMLDYIAVPLMIKYYPSKNFNLEFGPQMAFNVNKKIKLKAEGQTLTYDIDDFFSSGGLDFKTNTFDFGLNFGMGYELDNGLNFNGRYSLGMTKVFEGSDVVRSDGTPQNIKNSVFSFGLGYSFK